MALYDTIGVNYANLRQTDPRLAALVHAQLGDARSVVNVGAGTGSYEPADLDVTAVEPSAEMIRQRPKDAAPCVQATAEDLPFDDNSFDAAMAVLTVHHWSDQRKGLRELRRVSRGPVVVMSCDAEPPDCWLLDYFPALAKLDAGQMPSARDYEQSLGPVSRIELPVPHDCIDGFLYAYWRRPGAYLNPKVRAAMSSFSKIGDVGRELDHLSRDLDSGVWKRKYGHFLERKVCNLGYHLLVAG